MVFPLLPESVPWTRAKVYLEAVFQDAELLLAATDELVALNISAQKSALTDSLVQAGSLLASRNSKELLAALYATDSPRLEKTMVYGCVFYDRMVQLQGQIWRMAEITSGSVTRMLGEPQGDCDPDGEARDMSREAARSLSALTQQSVDAMRTTGRQLAAAVERNVAVMALASVQMSRAAKKEIEDLILALP